MNKIDLIIDALERANELWLTEPIGGQALTAARELRDAESKKAQWGNPKYLIEEAVLVEREACAKLCDDWFASTAGRAIRERVEPLAQPEQKLNDPPAYVEPPTSDYHNGWEEGFEAAKNLFKEKNI